MTAFSLHVLAQSKLQPVCTANPTASSLFSACQLRLMHLACCRHEIVGIVTAIGSKVKDFKVGDRAGVGCMVDSCKECEQCNTEGEEQFCPKNVQTYNSKDLEGTPTLGGYSTHIIVLDR